MAIVKDLGMVTAYAYAVAGGYEGTETEFTELLGQAGVTLEQLENLSAVAVTLAPGSEATASYTDGVLTFGIPQGDKGDKGDTGNGITSIAKTGTSGLVDTYTITYTNGNTMTFTVTNGAQGNPGPTGNGISSIAKTGTSGLVDTYTITFTDGTTTTFDVTNGEDGTVTPEQMAAAIAGALVSFATGKHDNMTAGLAEQLLSDVQTIDKKPYLFRRTGADATREYDTLVGGSVVANQLVDSGTTSVTLTSGHKYYTAISGTATIQAGSGSAVSVTGGTDTVTDLTQMFGSSIADHAYTLEQAKPGSGIAWLKSYGFFAGYQAYNAGSMVHVSGIESHDMTGFNQWDEQWESGSYDTDGNPSVDATRIRTKNPIKVLPGTRYYFHGPNTLGTRWYDADDNYISGIANVNIAIASPINAHYMRFSVVNNTTYNHNICINFDNPARNGQYEPYTVNSYTLDDTLTLRGIPKLSNGEMYYDGDTYAHDGTVTRKYGIRAYQAGDESLTDAITDGTNTVYKLTTPTTESATPYQSPQICDPDGTEQYVGSAIPVGHNTKYPANLAGRLEKLPDIPTTAGTYNLQVTVTSGKAVAEWVAV